MIKEKKVYLFVDGSNLYGGQYELFGPKNYLSFSKFIKEVENRLKVKFSKIMFYTSFSPKKEQPSQKAKLFLKNEGLFYKKVRETKKVSFFLGYRSKTSGKEKEVDVKLAVDIVNFSHLDKYDELFLISGDADFMHALKIAKRRKKKISIIALENRIPNRFAFHYPTSIFIFNKNFNRLIDKKQKIKKYYLNKEDLIESIE